MRWNSRQGFVKFEKISEGGNNKMDIELVIENWESEEGLL